MAQLIFILTIFRNTEGKTALDVADAATVPVLSGSDYKKEELLEASRYLILSLKLL